MLRMRKLGVGLVLSFVCSVHACGKSEREVDAGEGGESAGGSGGDVGGTASGGTAGSSTGGFGACDGVYCRSGTIGLGPCPGETFTNCDRDVSGVDCVALGQTCPSIGTGGSGGAGVTGGSGGFGGSDCDALHCSAEGRLTLGPCPGGMFTPCNPAVSLVECVSVGPCPRTGEGGQGGEGGAP